MNKSEFLDKNTMKSQLRNLSLLVAGIIWATWISGIVMYKFDAPDSMALIYILPIVFVIIFSITICITKRLIKSFWIILATALIPIVLSFLIPQFRMDPEAYYLNKACSEVNEEYCEKVPKSSSDCYMKIAVSKNDLSICNRINTGEPSNETKYKCIAKIGVERNDPKICEMIPVSDQYVWITNLRTTCLSSVSAN